jgi:hypothetical protein
MYFAYMSSLKQTESISLNGFNFHISFHFLDLRQDLSC